MAHALPGHASRKHPQNHGLLQLLPLFQAPLFLRRPRRRRSNSNSSNSNSNSNSSRSFAVVVLGIPIVIGLFSILHWCVFPRFHDSGSDYHRASQAMEYNMKAGGGFVVQYENLVGLAAHALAEGQNKAEPDDLWKEPSANSSAWIPCANNTEFAFQRPVSTGYIMVSANGGLNQQRIAICNAVAVAYLLNATLVIPKFLYSNVWKDNSQFEDIYQLDIFMEHLKDDITIVQKLPEHLQSLDLEAVGSLITDMDVTKEAKPSFYVKHILPILLRNRVVHFYGFGHRLSFDPVPFHIQRLRCKCNFHALKFSSKIQRTAALLITRMREQNKRWTPVENKAELKGVSSSNLASQLIYIENENSAHTFSESSGVYKYLGLHLRFEIDMAAYSMCEFGGGESEKMELEAYREIHFPMLTKYKNGGKILSATALREDGKCPMTPEEAALMLAALGFNRETRIYLAGAQFFGGQSRTVALLSLYPNLVTKEDLLSPKEIEPFIKSSSQLAALDFIVSATADAFAMTDPGSQFSALVSGYRMYYGEGNHPTIRPNKRRLASILSKSKSMDWDEFQTRIRKSIKETKRVDVRPVARSVYRHPRCHECMCQQLPVSTKVKQSRTA